MSGHSKWANIRVRKGAQDARRGKIYTKYARLIEIAAREGGGDPVTNIRLRALIDSAKSESVPNANIERAIKKGTGELKGAAQMEEMIYEAYGPGGSALIIECLSDNRNRTLGNVKTILGKNGGRFAESGSVMWMFKRKGVVMGATRDDFGKDASAENGASRDASARRSYKNKDELELALIDIGAEDISFDGDAIRVVTAMTGWPKVRDHLKANGFKIQSASLQYVAKQEAPVDEAIIAKIHALIDALEEDEDVSEVHTNAVS